MSDSKVYISDYTSLVRLKEALGGSGDSLLNILSDVDNYLQGKLQQFEERKEQIRQQLEQAKKCLQQAEEAFRATEEAYSDCLSSQREYEDEDGHTYISPSCSCERSSVESARQHKEQCQAEVYKCQKNYDTAERIVSDCKHEIDEYKLFGSFLRPNGGEKTLQHIADSHTKEAQDKLGEILEVVVKEYLGRSVIEEINPEETLPPSKAESFNKAAAEVKDKMHEQEIAVVNMNTNCPNCKRPFAICTCGRQENQRGYGGIPPQNRVNAEVQRRLITDFQNARR